MNSIGLSIWFLILIAAIIVIVYIISMLPQSVIWLLFILLFELIAVSQTAAAVLVKASKASRGRAISFW